MESNEEGIKKGEINVLKCRDDHDFILFKKVDKSGFKLVNGSECTWIEQDEPFRPNKLRERIEPWLTALGQSEYFSLLIGSGLSEAVHCIAVMNEDGLHGKDINGMQLTDLAVFDFQIKEAVEKSAQLAGRDAPNIEDQIRVINEMLKGIQYYCPESAEFRGSKKLKKEIQKLRAERVQMFNNFSTNILKTENDIISAKEEKLEKAFGFLISFLMSFASRSGIRDHLQIFTTNYDRLIEAGAEMAGLHLLDRFVGNLSPIFRSSRLNIDMHYNPPGIRGEPRYLEGVVRFTKLHGSLDWINCVDKIRRVGLPFGAKSVDPYLNFVESNTINYDSLMIYPNEAKDRETAEYPYVELFRDFASSICRPNNTLVTYGYGFGDEHINRVIEDMLTIPSTHLVIISYSDPIGRIIQTYKRISRPAQTTLMIGNQLGDLESLVNYYLPKPAIDRTTFRMAELLKNRMGIEQKNEDANTNVKK